jgi:hypothetical protein
VKILSDDAMISAGSGIYLKSKSLIFSLFRFNSIIMQRALVFFETLIKMPSTMKAELSIKK